MVTLEEAKAYLRVDSSFEDDLISSLLLTAEALCTDVARLSAQEWKALSDYDPQAASDDEEIEDSSDADSSEGFKKPDTLVIRQVEKSRDEILQMRELLRVGVLYTVGYLYEHREAADHHGLVLTLRNLLFSIREGVV